MKFKMFVEVEQEASHVIVELPVQCEEEDMPNDFPLRQGDVWKAKIEIDTGKIEGWPQGRSGEFGLEVCDSGIYTLLDPNGNTITTLRDYVPHGLIPGEVGDYVDMYINAEGVVTNWRTKPDLSAFFEDGGDV